MAVRGTIALHRAMEPYILIHQWYISTSLNADAVVGSTWYDGEYNVENASGTMNGVLFDQFNHVAHRHDKALAVDSNKTLNPP